MELLAGREVSIVGTWMRDGDAEGTVGEVEGREDEDGGEVEDVKTLVVTVWNPELVGLERREEDVDVVLPTGVGGETVTASEVAEVVPKVVKVKSGESLVVLAAAEMEMVPGGRKS
jgi:hypothetical protein